MIAQTMSQLAYQALRDLGCLRPGGIPSADTLNDILTAGNSMLDAWLLDEFLVFADTASAYPLTAGIQQYIIGPTQPPSNYIETNYPSLYANGYAYIQAPRPTSIDDCNIILNTFSPVVRNQVEIINRDQWAAIAVQQLPDAIPLMLYPDFNFDNTYGFMTLNLWPGPLYAYELELYTWQQLQSFPDLVTAISFPPGYARLVQKNLAVEIAPMMELYNKIGKIDRNVSATMYTRVKQQAKEAMDLVKSYNAYQPVITCDEAYLSTHRRGAWNYGTGLIGRGPN